MVLGKLLVGYTNIFTHHHYFPRQVMYWSVVKVFGHLLATNEDTTLSSESKQAVWTAVLFAFWGSTRFGDFIPSDAHHSTGKLLTWDRIQVVDDNHIAVDFGPSRSDEADITCVGRGL